MASSLVGQQPLGACREMVSSAVVATLYAYRRYCASSSSAVQLILPEALKLLPLYALSLLKGAGLKVRGGAGDAGQAAWCMGLRDTAVHGCIMGSGVRDPGRRRSRREKQGL